MAKGLAGPCPGDSSGIGEAEDEEDKGEAGKTGETEGEVTLKTSGEAGDAAADDDDDIEGA